MSGLVNQLKEIIARMEPEAIKRGINVPTDIQPLTLNATGQKTAHPGDIGDALRLLGYVRVRRWEGVPGDGAFQARWFPATLGNVFNEMRRTRRTARLIKAVQLEMTYNVSSS